MGRKAPPCLSETDQLALSQFLAGHLTAGQLSERLQHGEQRSRPSPERPPRHHRRMVPAAVGGVVAAIAATAVALAITSRPHVAASHRASKGHGQKLFVRGSTGVVSEQRTTSSAQRPSVGSADRLTVVDSSAPAARPKRPKRNRHKSSKARHLRAPAATVPTTSSTGGSTPTATTPTGTTPTGTTPTGTNTALPPPGSGAPPGGATTPGATTPGATTTGGG